MSQIISIGPKPDKVKIKAEKSFAQRAAWHAAISLRDQDFWIVLFLGLFLGFWIVHRYSYGMAGLVVHWKGYDKNPPWLVEAEKRDLKIGQTLSLKLLTFDGQPLLLPQRGTPTVLAFTGNCTACATRDNMESMQDLAVKFPKTKFYIVVMTGDREAAQSLWQAGHVTVPLVIDKNGDAAAKANALYNFRRYVFDSNGKLLYVNKREESSHAVNNRIETLLAQNGG